MRARISAVLVLLFSLLAFDGFGKSLLLAPEERSKLKKKKDVLEERIRSGGAVNNSRLELIKQILFERCSLGRQIDNSLSHKRQQNYGSADKINDKCVSILAGTVWTAIDSDGDYIEYHFKKGGVLHY